MIFGDPQNFIPLKIPLPYGICVSCYSVWVQYMGTIYGYMVTRVGIVTFKK